MDNPNHEDEEIIKPPQPIQSEDNIGTTELSSSEEEEEEKKLPIENESTQENAENDENDKNDENENNTSDAKVIIGDDLPTFATTTEDIDVHIHNENNTKKNSNTNSSSSISYGDMDSKNGKKRRTKEEQDKHNFYKMMTSSPTNNSPTSRLESYSQQKTTSINRPPSVNLSNNEVITIADNLLKGKKVNLKDPSAVADVIKELDSRRIVALNQSEYLKSKKIGDIIDSLKIQLYQADRDLMFKENIEVLTQKHEEALEALEEAKAEWKKKHQDFVEECKSEASDIQNKHENERMDLDSKWMDPATQRKFTKRSPYLLQQKAVEKYMVLAGNLEGAEQTKKLNMQNERIETQMQYVNMQESYETSRKQLLEQHNSELEKMRTDQEYRYKQLMQNEQKALEVCRKRISAAQRNLEEQSSMERFAAKKFKKSADCVLPLSVINASEDLPPLSRGKGFAKTESQPSCVHQAAKPSPLQLPPLKVKQTRQQKIIVSFK